MEIVRSGSWLYDGVAPLPVDIVGLDYDYWHEVGRADGTLTDDERPEAPGAEGLLYYVRFRSADQPDVPTVVDSGPYRSVADAVASAEQRAPSPITWR